MTRKIALSTAIALLLTALSQAANNEQGFVPLFNGKDTAGWTYGKNAKGAEAKAGKGYQIKEGGEGGAAGGVLYCTKSDGGMLYTEKEYADFVLRLEFKLTENANNGIALRAPLTGDPAYAGIELQILDDEGSEYKTLRPTQYHGSVYDVIPAKRGHLLPVGQWNDQEVTAQGSKITVKLNGQTIVNADLGEIKDEAVLKKHPGLKRTKGHIGFAGHGKEVEFRNIRIKEL